MAGSLAVPPPWHALLPPPPPPRPRTPALPWRERGICASNITWPNVDNSCQCHYKTTSGTALTCSHANCERGYEADTTPTKPCTLPNHKLQSTTKSSKQGKPLRLGVPVMLQLAWENHSRTLPKTAKTTTMTAIISKISATCKFCGMLIPNQSESACLRTLRKYPRRNTEFD